MKHTHTDTDLPIENKYPKLVRDNIPAIVKRDCKTANTHIAGQDEYVGYLLSKLIEEATELRHAESSDQQKEEMVDVQEVLEALRAALDFSETELAEIKASKFEERGGFDGRIILDSLPE
jgi:predicted house-cleaning noncanonical NTP pyrophosphatase (MazG superfamily)